MAHHTVHHMVHYMVHHAAGGLHADALLTMAGGLRASGLAQPTLRNAEAGRAGTYIVRST